MVVDPANTDNDYAKIELQYKQSKRYPIFNYNTGNIDGQKADTNTFRLFQHYYLSALRDSTKDLLSNRNNILGKVIKRLVERKDSEEEIKDIIKEANKKLLEREEVISTRDNINTNLENIYKNVNQTQIGLQIEQSRIDYIVNVIKPFLPHDWKNQSTEGFNLRQNSLGFNNLIYIATVLGDIKERIKDDPIPHFALLIEEPEAHIHPQLQLSLYNFLKEANNTNNSQLFLTKYSEMIEQDLDEYHWQQLFEQNPFILNLAFGVPIIKVRGNAYVGGRKIQGGGDKIADFLVKNSISNNAAIIEIKKPSTQLLGVSTYRKDVHAPSTDLLGATNQLLDQINKFQRSIATLKDESQMYDLESYSVVGVLVIGRSSQLQAERKSFELFRGNSKNITMLTFDELLEKLRQLKVFLESDDNLFAGVSEEDLPF